MSPDEPSAPWHTPLPVETCFQPPARRWPGLFIYKLPKELTQHARLDHRGDYFLSAMCSNPGSGHVVSQPEDADFFLVPGSFRGGNQPQVTAVLRYARWAWPSWNRSIARGFPNHILSFPNDQGLHTAPGTPTMHGEADPTMDLASPRRMFVGLSFNGNPALTPWRV